MTKEIVLIIVIAQYDGFFKCIVKHNQKVVWIRAELRQESVVQDILEQFGLVPLSQKNQNDVLDLFQKVWEAEIRKYYWIYLQCVALIYGFAFKP